MGDLQRLIAFDLDGTLVDSRRDLADSANELITELGGASLPEEAVGAMVGEGAALLVRRALAAARVSDVGTALKRFLEYSGLGDHPRVVAAVAARARELRKAGRLPGQA